jgi:uncharacterized membrane protein YraQ (UPF0718 family)
VAYGVASVSGTLLAVCSCTVLPMFGGIHANGAGLGPASAFLYSGPAINVLAIVLTANVLGLEIGVARALGAVVFALVIGLLMHLIFRRSEMERSGQWMATPGGAHDPALYGPRGAGGAAGRRASRVIVYAESSATPARELGQSLRRHHGLRRRPRRSQLRHHGPSIRHQDRLSRSNQSQVVGQPVLQLPDSDGTHTSM